MAPIASRVHGVRLFIGSDVRSVPVVHPCPGSSRPVCKCLAATCSEQAAVSGVRRVQLCLASCWGFSNVWRLCPHAVSGG
eukprot:13982248-Alexandrium_andersonii.AAC.1